MIKFNKQFFKRWSTLANFVAIIAAAAMAHIPDMLPSHSVPCVMCAFSVLVAVCQMIRQGGNNDQ